MTDNSDESAGLNQFTSEWFNPEELLQEVMQQKRAQRIADAPASSTSLKQIHLTK